MPQWVPVSQGSKFRYCILTILAYRFSEKTSETTVVVFLPLPGPIE